MKYIIGLKELRQNVSMYANRVAKGESFVVMRRSIPLFRISPVNDGGWESVADFSQTKKGGVSATKILEMLRGV